MVRRMLEHGERTQINLSENTFFPLYKASQQTFLTKQENIFTLKCYDVSAVSGILLLNYYISCRTAYYLLALVLNVKCGYTMLRNTVCYHFFCQTLVRTLRSLNKSRSCMICLC